MDRAVLDASVVVDLLISPPAASALARIVGSADLAAPGGIDAEVLHALRRLVRNGTLSEAHGRVAVEGLVDIPIDRLPVAELGLAVWGMRENLTAYDATYVALARALGCPLLTADERLAATPMLESGEVVVVRRS